MTQNITPEAVDALLSQTVQNAEQDRMLSVAVKVDILKEKTGIDITKIHCRKTGQPIATLNTEEVEKILNFYSVSRLEDIINTLDITSGVSMIWKHTNPEFLNKLQATDPKGFYCYCINILLRNHHMQWVQNKKVWKTVESEKKFQNSLVRAWYAIAEFEETELVEANKLLRFFMYLDLHNNSRYRIPWHLMYSNLNNKFERVLFAQYDGVLRPSIAYNPDVRPLYPEEFATKHGIEFIAFCLKSFLDLMHVKTEADLQKYKNLHTASAFRRTHKPQIAEIDIQLSDMQGFQNYTLEGQIAKAKMIMERESKKTKAVTLDSAFDLGIIIVDGQYTLPGEIEVPMPEVKVSTEGGLKFQPLIKNTKEGE